jgi:3-methyladenine DNA glycosylase AlkC
MNTPTLEDVYETLARSIDAVGPPHTEVYLAKVCLSLARALDDPERARRIVSDCTRDLLPASDGK